MKKHSAKQVRFLTLSPIRGHISHVSVLTGTFPRLSHTNAENMATSLGTILPILGGGGGYFRAPDTFPVIVHPIWTLNVLFQRAHVFGEGLLGTLGDRCHYTNK
ncbi:hypothetical protein FKM82_025258 [Ascaphus truei]